MLSNMNLKLYLNQFVDGSTIIFYSFPNSVMFQFHSNCFIVEVGANCIGWV